MAKKSIVAREKRKHMLVDKYRQRRLELKDQIKSSVNIEDVMNAQAMLTKLPLNSSSVRSSSRCNQCGRSHAVYRKFGLCRICFREMATRGEIPGITKSSW